MSLPTPYYDEAGITLFCGRCEDILPHVKAVDLVLTDPPYGSGLSMAFNDRFTHKAGGWWKNTDRSTCNRHTPIIGDDEPFDPSSLLQFPKVITWGANWYASRLPDSGGWFVWDKRHGVEKAEWPMSEGEIAWTNICQSVRFFRHRWFGLLRESEKGLHYHPTQKPVALMRWCLEQAKDAQIILDPYCGSGPVLVAAKQLGRRAIGIEIEEKYCQIAVERLRQSVLPFPAPTPALPVHQAGLFDDTGGES